MHKKLLRTFVLLGTFTVLGAHTPAKSMNSTTWTGFTDNDGGYNTHTVSRSGPGEHTVATTYTPGQTGGFGGTSTTTVLGAPSDREAAKHAEVQSTGSTKVIKN
jgi:hypothetical protein